MPFVWVLNPARVRAPLMTYVSRYSQTRVLLHERQRAIAPIHMPTAGKLLAQQVQRLTAEHVATTP